MREINDEYVMGLIDKYHDILIADLEESMCLDCYNLAKRLNLTENDVELENSVCKMCNKQKTCVKKLK